MILSANLSRLRFGLKALFVAQQTDRVHNTPGLHHLLVLPLPQRLLLLAALDGATEKQRAKALKIETEYVSLDTPTMQAAIAHWQAEIAAPFGHWPTWWVREDLTPECDLTTETRDMTGSRSWSKRSGVKLERQLAGLLWADTAVTLIGHSVPATLAQLTLRSRLILYCVLVEGLTYRHTAEALKGTKWEVEHAIHQALATLEACQCPRCASSILQHTFTIQEGNCRLSCPAQPRTGSRPTFNQYGVSPAISHGGR
jgi:hypothetical protein